MNIILGEELCRYRQMPTYILSVAPPGTQPNGENTTPKQVAMEKQEHSENGLNVFPRKAARNVLLPAS